MSDQYNFTQIETNVHNVCQTSRKGLANRQLSQRYLILRDSACTDEEKAYRAKLLKLDKDIDKLKSELRKLKSDELARVIRECTYGEYEQKNGGSLDKICETLFGVMNAKKELRKFSLKANKA
jgi:hypothetical protein